MVLITSTIILDESVANRKDGEISTVETILLILTCGWAITQVNEIIFVKRGTSLWNAIRIFFGDTWNMLDIVIIALTGAAVYNHSTLVWFKILIALDVFVMWIRLVEFVSKVDQKLGVMVRGALGMLTQVYAFFSLLVFLMMGYGLASYALLYPRGLPLRSTVLYHVLLKPYWQMYGELFLESYDDPHDITCPPNYSLFTFDGSGSIQIGTVAVSSFPYYN
jgi:hypothetical protein